MRLLEGSNHVIWGLLVDWVLLVGVYLSLGLDFLPLRLLPRAVMLWWRSRHTPSSEDGEASPWLTAMAALGGLVGIGNITGIAFALMTGGPGSLVWIWISALVGLATKFCETLLSTQYRRQLPNGRWIGGPMVALRQALPAPLCSLGVLYAVAASVAVFGLGNALQSQFLAEVLNTGLQIPPLVTGIGMAVLTYAVIIGGLPRIGLSAAWLMPLSCCVYAGCCLLVILAHPQATARVVIEIVDQGLSPRAMASGTLAATISTGIRYAVGDSESGMGSTATFLACGQPAQPLHQACIAMVLTLIDVLISTATALVILLSGSLQQATSPIAVVHQAFNWGLGDSHWLIVLVAAAFAFTTITTFAYYGERCLNALCGDQGNQLYRLAWVAVVVVGSVSHLDMIWRGSELLNALVTLPNLIGLVLLSNRIFVDTRSLLPRPVVPIRPGD